MSRWRGEGVGEGEGLRGWRGRGSVWDCGWALSLTGARRAGKGAVGCVVYSFYYSPVEETDAEVPFWYIPSLYTFAFFNPVHSESLTAGLRSKRALKGLPSWVPDGSQAQMDHGVVLGLVDGFNAGGADQIPVVILSDSTLERIS
jgi:hypothetical protein